VAARLASAVPARLASLRTAIAMPPARCLRIAVALLLIAQTAALKLGGLGGLSSAAPPKSKHFDLLVIGGGSGGLAASKAAAELGKRVAVCDFVTPSPQGTKWGLGGTCVNVGCIPKKLMHHAALLGEAQQDSRWYGWRAADEDGISCEVDHDWERLVQSVQNYVKSMNFAYKAQCRTNDVDYFDAFARFVDPHTVEATTRDGVKNVLTADQFIVCTGGRPSYPDIPGAREHAITSDDIFSLPSSPGKTLVVGGGYVALECAGFLHGLGCETTVAIRSVPLRGFDQQMAQHVVDHMAAKGVTFTRGATLAAVELLPSGKKRVSWESTGGVGSAPAAAEEFDTVLLAVGRDAFTHKMGLENAGVERHAETGKLPVSNEQTNVEHIYAIGDVIDGSSLNPPSELTELTPVAIQAGRLLANRLYGGSTVPMDYQLVPTTVYTPLEYGCVGYSEEAAIATFGDANIEVYHQYFEPLEGRIADMCEPSLEKRPACYAKLIVHAAEGGRVVGLHVCGPHAGEMTQGFAVAMRCGATKADFDNTVGIHPTTVEVFTTMDVTKRSGKSAQAKTC
jgi:thioredoxin reductase (NADPH)